MVPLNIALKNFLSYGQTTQYISFEPYSLICLSGKNGHGKSALLDALTWAVWGQARKTTAVRTDEQLIHLGQTQMMVCLDFLCNKIIYKIRREVTIHNSKIQTSLDFGIVDSETKQIKGLTDKTIKATQEKIITTIGLDYESFINSVFLRQGSSNEFSKKSPKDRKEILSSILGINQFELLKKKALEKSRTCTTQKETLHPIYQRLEQEILQKEKIENSLTLFKQDEKEVSEKITTIQNHLENGEKELQHALHMHARIQQYEQELQKITARINTGIEELRGYRKDFKKIIQQKINNKPVDKTLLEKLEKELDRLSKQEVTVLQLQKELLHVTHEQNYTAQKLQQEQTRKIHESDIRVQKSDATVTLLSNYIDELTQKITFLQNTLTKKYGGDAPSYLIQKYEKYKEHYHILVNKKNSLIAKQQDKEALAQKLYANQTAFCPLCEQSLVPHKREHLYQSFCQDLLLVDHQLKRLQNFLPALKQTVVTLHNQVESSKEAAVIQQQIQQLQQELTDKKDLYDKERKVLQELKDKKNALVQEGNSILELDEIYQKLAARIQQLNHQLTAIPAVTYAEKAALQAQIEKMKAISEPEGIKVTVQQIKQTVRLTIKHLKLLKYEQRELLQNKASLSQNMPTITLLEKNIREIKTTLANHNHQVHALLEQIGSYQEQLTRLSAQENELQRLTDVIKKCTYSEELYQTIAHALGKDGIPALLIEQVIPEIEQEANYLLGKLTDNQAHLFIESVRDLKSGKTKETLDIHISDATGIRPYELFSGGEAFRIDFALRIALSKLLARRAGASLQTLIIDEGFGSQDEEGLSNIMEALYKIQDDFAKIIIVSHLPSMKDQFPVHFVVTKTAKGSSVKVIEQG